MTKKELLESKAFQDAPMDAEIIQHDYTTISGYATTEYISYDDLQNWLIIG